MDKDKLKRGIIALRKGGYTDTEVAKTFGIAESEVEDLFMSPLEKSIRRFKPPLPATVYSGHIIATVTNALEHFWHVESEEEFAALDLVYDGNKIYMLDRKTMLISALRNVGKEGSKLLWDYKKWLSVECLKEVSK